MALTSHPQPTFPPSTSRWLTTMAICLWLLTGITASSDALEIPALTGQVVDLAHLLSPETRDRLTATLRQHELQTTQQIAILTIPTLHNETIEEFSHRVASNWKLGQAGHDNGVLIILARHEGRVRLEVGYGLESTLTDARSRQLLDDAFLPEFTRGRFNEGMMHGVTALLALLAPLPNGEPLATEPVGESSSPTRGHAILILSVIALIFVGGLIYSAIEQDPYDDDTESTVFPVKQSAAAALGGAALASAVHSSHTNKTTKGPVRSTSSRLDPWERTPGLLRRQRRRQETPLDSPDWHEPLTNSPFITERSHHDTSEMFTGHGGEFGGGGASASFDTSIADSSFSDSASTFDSSSSTD